MGRCWQDEGRVGAALCAAKQSGLCGEFEDFLDPQNRILWLILVARDDVPAELVGFDDVGRIVVDQKDFVGLGTGAFGGDFEDALLGFDGTDFGGVDNNFVVDIGQ